MSRLKVIPRDECPHCGRKNSPNHEPVFVAGLYAGCYEPKNKKAQKK